jgi:hypothetical protein
LMGTRRGFGRVVFFALSFRPGFYERFVRVRKKRKKNRPKPGSMFPRPDLKERGHLQKN